MKRLLLLMRVFYHFTNRSPVIQIPYFTTLMSFSLLSYLNIASLFSLLGLRKFIFSPLPSLILLFGILPFLFFKAGNECLLKRSNPDVEQLRLGKRRIIVWLLFSIAFMITSLELTRPR